MQIVRRVRPVRLVVGIDLGAERLLRLVEHHRQMGRLLLRLHVAQELPQHVAEAEHGVDLQAVRLAGERRQRVIGAENVAGAVDQKDVVAFLAAGRDAGTRRAGAEASRQAWLWARIWLRHGRQCWRCPRTIINARARVRGERHSAGCSAICGLGASQNRSRAARTGSASGVSAHRPEQRERADDAGDASRCSEIVPRSVIEPVLSSTSAAAAIGRKKAR